MVQNLPQFHQCQRVQAKLHQWSVALSLSTNRSGIHLKHTRNGTDESVLQLHHSIDWFDRARISVLLILITANHRNPSLP